MNARRLFTGIAVAGAVFLIIAAIVLTLPHQRSQPVVYIIYGSEKGDLSYTDSAYRGLFAAQEALSFSKREFTSFDTPSLVGSLCSDNRAEKPGLIITVSYAYAEKTKLLSEKCPEIRFLAIDQTGIGSGTVRAYEISSYGESYLAGVLAASVTKTRRVGIILGTRSALLDGFRLGYIAGVHEIDPSIIVDQEYVRDNSTDGFSDPEKAAEIAGGMYRYGSDVIYTVAGYSGTGAISTAKAAPGRYIIGVDSDQTHLGPAVVIASAVKRVDRVVYTGISDYLNGSFTGGEQVAGLRDGVTGLSFNPAFSSYNATVSAYQASAEEAEAKYLATRS